MTPEEKEFFDNWEMFVRDAVKAKLPDTVVQIIKILLTLKEKQLINKSK